MTQPTSYTQANDFESELGTATGAHLDQEFQAIQLTLSELLANIALIQRDDTKLANQTVHPDTFTTAAKLLMASDWTPRGLWVTTTVYNIGDVVQNGTNSYVCAAQHVSGTFATDASAGKWITLYQPLSSAGLAANLIAFTPTGNVSSTNVQAAVAEASAEALQKALNLSDIPSPSSALANLGGMPKTGGAFSGVVELHYGDDIAAGATTDLATATGNAANITGAATIAALGTVQAGAIRYLTFSGICTIQHNATSLILPGNANIVTAAGDSMEVVSLGSGNWKCLRFQRQAYLVPPPSSASVTYTALDSTITKLLNGKNRIINGAMSIDQRNGGAAQTFTAGAALAYAVDRWYGYCTGANATGQRVAGASRSRYRYQFTGAASVSAIGFGHRIEAAHSYDLNSQTATLSVDLANSLLSTVSWAAYYANSSDAFGSLASPTRTAIASGTFTVNSTVSRYSTPITIPAAATTGIEIVFSVGAQTSGTWTIGDVQLEYGSVSTDFERRPDVTELQLCQRYYEKSFAVATKPAQNVGAGTGEFDFMAGKAGAAAEFGTVRYRVPKRAAATTLTLYNPAAANAQVRDETAAADCSAAATASSTDQGFRITATGNAGTAVGNILGVHWTAEAEVP